MTSAVMPNHVMTFPSGSPSRSLRGTARSGEPVTSRARANRKIASAAVKPSRIVEVFICFIVIQRYPQRGW
jgi:hypothetical protein